MVISAPDLTIPMRIISGVFWIYFVPPLLCRTILLCFGVPLGINVFPNSRAFKVWWWLTQIQMLFNRFSILEEGLRFIPGMYALWLNLWGATVSVEAFWSPGVFIADRYLVCVKKGVVLGSRCLISGHVVTGTTQGYYALTVGLVTIQPYAIVGAHAIIGPGCYVHTKETIPIGRILPPFTIWKAGRKERAANS